MTIEADLRPEDRKIVLDILRAYLPATAAIFVFGSRAVGATKRASDLDLAIDAGGPLSHLQVSNLAEAFEESDLPYKVDIVDLHQVSDTFKEIIGKDMKALDMTEVV
jgi:predicted nucleotidyltransferase